MLGCDSIEECLYIPWIPTFCYHDRPSHEARGVGVASFPTLSISDAERRAYYNRRSDALNPQRIFDTLWILVRSDLSRLAATGQACGCKAGYRQDASLESLRYSFNPTLALAARWGQTHPHTTK